MLSRDFDRDHAFRMNWGHRYQTSAENLEWCKTLTGASTYTNLQALMLMRIAIQPFSPFLAHDRGYKICCLQMHEMILPGRMQITEPLF